VLLFQDWGGLPWRSKWFARLFGGPPKRGQDPVRMMCALAKRIAAKNSCALAEKRRV